MTGTDAHLAYHVFAKALLQYKDSDVTYFDTCSDHGYGVYLSTGLEQDGQLLLKYVERLSSGNETEYLQFMLSWNASNHTCHIKNDTMEDCLYPVSPFAVEGQENYTINGTAYPCSQAPNISVNHRVFNQYHWGPNMSSPDLLGESRSGKVISIFSLMTVFLMWLPA